MNYISNPATTDEDKFFYPSPSYLPTRILFGLHAARSIGGEYQKMVRAYRVNKPAVIVGQNAMAMPWLSNILADLQNFNISILFNPGSNPTFDDVNHIADMTRKTGADCIIGIGGGSVLDMTKAVSAVLASGRSIESLLRSSYTTFDALPIVAIPTTAGTGSEVSTSATIWDSKNKVKLSLSGPNLIPKLAIVDPMVCATLPRDFIGGTALDALAHAMESSWSINASEDSIPYGLSAIKLIDRHLTKRLEAPENTEHLAALSRASLDAGISMAIGKTTISHAISYPLTAHYGVHHGHACGLSLGALLCFNSDVHEKDCADKRGFLHTSKVMGKILNAFNVESASAGERKLHALIKKLGLRTFEQFPGFDLDLIAEQAFASERFRNNPRVMNRRQIQDLVKFLSQPSF